MTTNDTTHHDALTDAAKADARIFAAEYPGETIDGSDWDSEAFAQLDGAAAEAEEAMGDDAWPVYRDALHAAVGEFAAANTPSNPDAISWYTPRECQGQIVTDMYGIAEDGQRWERTFDASDRTVQYRKLDDDGPWEPWNGRPPCALGEDDPIRRRWAMDDD